VAPRKKGAKRGKKPAAVTPRTRRGRLARAREAKPKKRTTAPRASGKASRKPKRAPRAAARGEKRLGTTKRPSRGVSRPSAPKAKKHKGTVSKRGAKPATRHTRISAPSKPGAVRKRAKRVADSKASSPRRKQPKKPTGKASPRRKRPKLPEDVKLDLESLDYEGFDTASNRDGTADAVHRVEGGADDFLEWSETHEFSALPFGWLIRTRVKLKVEMGLPESMVKDGVTHFQMAWRRPGNWLFLVVATLEAIRRMNEQGFEAEWVEVILRYDGAAVKHGHGNQG